MSGPLGSSQWMYASGFEIDQSLRFNDDDSAYLSWTPSSAGNRKTWTWSGWVKRGNLSTYQTIFAVDNGSTEIAECYWDGSDNSIFWHLGGGSNYRFYTNAIYRDSSAWYHIVCSLDTTISSPSGNDTRMKLYVNGEQVTSFRSNATPSLNYEGLVNLNTQHEIGERNGTHNPLDGYLAEVNFIDGQALTPADFGETGDYGEWKPKQYSGTFGTNGFYLPFKADYTVEGFSTVIYKGNGGKQYIGGTGFKPDFTWIKKRDGSDNHALYNSLMPTYNYLRSDTTQDERTNGQLSAKTDGFLLGNGDGSWNASNTYVAWNWDMGADTPTGFGCVTYKGTGATQDISGMGFSPDLVWLKCRDAVHDHQLSDTVRGAKKTLFAASTEVEYTGTTDVLTKFNPDGFTVGATGTGANQDTKKFVAWGWDMGDTTATNTDGDITSTVRANPTYGQSVVSFTAPSSTGNFTIGHGLSSTPDMIITKSRSGAYGWWTWHKDLTNTTTYYLGLHTDAAEVSEANMWGAGHTSSTFGMNANASVVTNATYIAYCFHSVSGYSKFGSYTGSGSSGNTVTTGFRPAFVMVKNANRAENWAIVDSTRSPMNPATKALFPNSSEVEQDNAINAVDFNSNNFTVDSTDDRWNRSGDTYIYMAFAGGMDSISDYNTDGSIDSRVKANTTYGQSIVSYVGTGSSINTDTVGHGLSQKPDLYFLKNRDTANSWLVRTDIIDGSSDYLLLDGTQAKLDSGVNYADSSVFSLGASNGDNGSGDAQIAYCFHSVTGYSKFGSYEGTGSTGNAITTGFKPAMILIKNADSSSDWTIIDSTRNPSDPRTRRLEANNTDAEVNDTSYNNCSFTTTGFTWLADGTNTNASGDTYVYMAFADNREYAYWLDQSGNNNDWTSNNLTESDISVDSPTNNFATWNPLYESGGTTFSEGNLQVSVPTNKHATNTFSPTSGKWYTEICMKTIGSTVGELDWGWLYAPNYTDTSAHAGKANKWGAYYHAYSTDHIKLFDETTEGSNINMTISAGDILQLVLDIDNTKGWLGKNNTFYASDGGTDGNPATGANPTFTFTAAESVGLVNYVANGANTDVFIANFGQDSSFAGTKTAQGNQDGNDIGDFYYTPPTGFLALCTKNLPDVDVTPSEHFNTVLYSGNGSTQSITGVGFQPDWVWAKSRSATDSHVLTDAVRGIQKAIVSNSTAAEYTDTTGLTSFNSNGFSIGSASRWNTSSRTYVAWNWKANGSGVSNTDGTITSTVSANTDAGFSIVSYTGVVASSGTIGHGLSKAPEMIILKRRSNTDPWEVLHHGIASDYETDILVLQDTDAAGDLSTIWNDTKPTSSVFSVGSSNNVNGTDDTYIAYCFHSVDGYSKVGSYTGNGNADGTFVYTGFRPAYILYKSTDNVTHWAIHNNKSNPFNVADTELHANETAAEASAAEYKIDFLSNGFKQRNTNGTNNGNGYNYIYIAFAEVPFKFANAR